MIDIIKQCVFNSLRKPFDIAEMPIRQGFRVELFIINFYYDNRILL